MMGDLGLFYILWAIILLTFTSIACLVFADLPEYENFFAALFMHFEASLGSWSTDMFCAENGSFGCWIGKGFMFVMLSVNMVLLLNLIIAILSSTYALFEDKKLGLYYEVLVGKFNTMEYDEKFGAAACAQPPLNLMIFPFWWLTLLPFWSDE